MNRKEKVLANKMQIATEAAFALKQHQQKDSATKRNALLERTMLYEVRESARPDRDRDIMISAAERIIRGKDDSKVKAPSQKIETTGAPVARLHELGAINEPKGFGTGFLVASNILMTNHHVFENAGDAVDCVANFNYQQSFASGKINQGVLYVIRPDVFFFNDEELDFALVYVAEESHNTDISLSSLGLLPLIESKGKVTKGSHINIIQYPQGGIKKYTTEDNEVIDIDDDKGIIYYYTDTEPGSSGSPGFNDFWEVSALHYTGVPEVNEAGQWLTTNGEIWDKKTMLEKDVRWIANAGKSISKIVSKLRSLNLAPDQQNFIDAILKNSNDPLKPNNENKPSTNNTIIPKSTNMEAGKYNFNFYASVTLNIHDNMQGIVGLQNNIKATQVSEGATEKKELFDEDYDSRDGYDENFIADFKVPMPSVAKSREKELYKNFGASVPYIIPYHHYSLVMNKKRRMAMWTASNVDYNKKFRDKRERNELGNGAWRLDPRIPAKYQIQADEFYDPATLVDKGHIVRRDDNCWALLKGGKSDSIGIEYANADTFHWTNCTPQHEAFNRDTAQYTGVGKWGVLENAIKKQLEFPQNDRDNDNKDFGQRACVLAGPVLSDDDPEYMDIQYPLKFWKVFAINSMSEGNLVYGFVLSQEDKIDENGLEKEGRPRFNRMVKAMQVSLKEIESMTGVLFADKLHECDVKAGSDSNESLRDDLANFKRK